MFTIILFLKDYQTKTGNINIQNINKIYLFKKKILTLYLHNLIIQKDYWPRLKKILMKFNR